MTAYEEVLALGGPASAAALPPCCGLTELRSLFPNFRSDDGFVLARVFAAAEPD
jgi:hypothetical protein